MKFLLVLALVMLPVPAAADPASAKAWWCAKVTPKWTRCLPADPSRPPPMMDEEEPVEWAPIPVPTPVVSKNETTAAPPAPPVASPPVSAPLPKPAPPPVVIERPRPAPQAKPRQREVERPVRKPRESCSLPVGCSTVCSYARAGWSIPPGTTACQIALGKACIRSSCPEILRRR